jgi:beta-phosphoglucomutase-like phosphatase (HAD superfamily)/dTDP-glucose pyrophosphorylase
MSDRLFIFDLDGVLVDSKQIHFDALNLALKEIDEKYVISEDQQAEIFEGLSTNQKLKILSETRNLPEEYYEKIWGLKQKKSIMFFQNLPEDKDLVGIFKVIKSYGVEIAVASNCIRDTVETCLKSLGILEYVSLYLGNQDVEHPKPNPEIYLKCMKDLGYNTWNTVIFEDSFIGRSAAVKSGAVLAGVENRKHLTIDFVIKYLDPKRKKINVLIPMAGEGSRFAAAGYGMPKPLIEVNGKSMINLVYDSINLDAHYIFVAKSEHIEMFNLEEHISSFCKDFSIVAQEGRLDGAALSSLLAKDLIDNDSHLVIANSDQYIQWDSEKDMDFWIRSGVDGSMLTFEAEDDKWSYAEIKDYFVHHVHEKDVVGKEATCGIYYWKSGSDFVKYAERMIEKEIKTNNEFYVAPVYNQAIQDGKIISYLRAGYMHGLGTPDDLQDYVRGGLPSFIPEDKSKYFFYNSDNLKSNDEPYIENVYRITDSEICVSYKNAKYEIFDKPSNAGYKLENVLDILEDPIYLLLNPVITSIDNDYVEKEEEKSVFLMAYPTRFYHIYLEILPKLFFLKKIDPNFKVIILGDSKVDKNKNFIGLDRNNLKVMLSREDECSSLKFWLEELDIEFECITRKDFPRKNLTFAKSYAFYEAKDPLRFETKKEYFDKWLNPCILSSIEYYPFWLFNRSEGTDEKDIIDYTRNEINLFLKNKKNTRKKIYISRKNYERVHPNETAIENFFRSKGFESVCMEDFTPEEQINICRSAEAIVCYVGSSMVNLYYLDPQNKETVSITALSLGDRRQPAFVAGMFNHYKSIITSETLKFSDNIKVNLLEIPPLMDFDKVYDVLQELTGW